LEEERTMKLSGILREAMRPLFLAWGAFLLVGSPALAGSVVESGFCLGVAGRDCTSRLSSRQQIALEALETDEQGRRVIYFQSTQAVLGGEIFVHAWERTGRQGTQAKPKVYSSQPLSEQVQQRVENFRLGVLEDALHVVMTATVGSETYRAVSSRLVPGPGKLVAKVVDSAGEDFPGSELHEVEILP